MSTIIRLKGHNPLFFLTNKKPKTSTEFHIRLQGSRTSVALQIRARLKSKYGFFERRPTRLSDMEANGRQKGEMTLA